MKRVLILTYYWPPSGGAGVQRWLKFVKYLPEFGWEPIVITVDPQSASYPVADSSLEKEIPERVRIIKTSTREFFTAYKKVSGREKIPYAGFANEKKRASYASITARFIRGNFFLPDPRKGWNKYALRAAEEILANEKIDCIITSSPPHSTQLIGLSLAKKYTIPWVADLRDPWTDIYYYRLFYPTFFAHRRNRNMERKVLENADLLVTVSPALEELFRSKSRKNLRIKVITNGYDPDDFIQLPAVKNDRFIITYVGTLADSYPAGPFISALKDFIKEHPSALLRCIGTIAPDQLALINSLPGENVELIPYVDHRRAIEYMRLSTVLLLLIPEHPQNKGIVTGKLYEYMAVERPVLVLGPVDGDAASIVTDEKAGKVANPSDTGMIRNSLEDWSKNLPVLKRSEKYSRKVLSRDLAETLDTL